MSVIIIYRTISAFQCGRRLVRSKLRSDPERTRSWLDRLAVSSLREVNQANEVPEKPIV